jgi:hypothetical protein
MYNHSAITAEKKIGNLFKFPYSKAHLFSIIAKADEGGEPTPTSQVNFEQAIALARKEEKDKLYPQLTKLKEENKAITQSLNDSLLREAQLKTELEELKKADNGSARIAELEAEIEKLKGEKQSILDSAPKEDDIRAKVEKEYEVKYYRDSQITANRDDILPVFDAEVTGATKEEVDASIAAVKQKTIEIYKAMGLVDEKGNIKKPTAPAPTTPPATTPTTPPATPPVANPSAEEETFDLEYVKNLDPRSPEYAEWRKKQGLK